RLPPWLSRVNLRFAGALLLCKRTDSGAMTRRGDFMAARPGKRLVGLLAGLMLAGLMPLSGAAQEADAPAEEAAPAEAASEPSPPSQADLEAIESSITLSQSRIEALKAEIAEMEGDRTRQNAALIAAAQRVRL